MESLIYLGGSISIDVQLAVEADISGGLVLSGETQMSHLSDLTAYTSASDRASALTYVLNSVADLL